MNNKTENETRAPLIVGVSRLAKILGVSRQRAKEVLVAIGVEPIGGVGAEGRPRYSYPQIIGKLENINEPKPRKAGRFATAR